MRWLRTLTGTVLLALAAAGWGWGWRGHRAGQDAAFARRRLTFLEGENRRLSGLLADGQAERQAGEDRAARAEIERRVAELRGLAFLRPVAYEEIPRSELPRILREKLAQQVPDQEFDRAGVALAALGLLPAGLDLKKTYLDLLGEQVGAFYDQHSAELFTFRGNSLANSQNRVILAHELTHALEDQHFHLARLPLEARGNDDRALAASALVEGDATLVMNQYLVGDLSAAVIQESLAGALSTDVRRLAAAPRYLRETLLFPYLRGQEFCAALHARGGWPALAAAFEHPPASTAQVLHPDRYLLDPGEEPARLDWPTGPVMGQEPIADNVLGEFGVRHLIVKWLPDDRQAKDAAAEWRGDRYRVYGDAGANSCVWRSAWSSPEAAARFFEAARRIWSARYPQAVAEPPGPADEVGTDLALINPAPPRALRLQRRGAEVTLVDAQDRRWLDALRTLAGPEAAPRP